MRVLRAPGVVAVVDLELDGDDGKRVLIPARTHGMRLHRPGTDPHQVDIEWAIGGTDIRFTRDPGPDFDGIVRH